MGIFGLFKKPELSMSKDNVALLDEGLRKANAAAGVNTVELQSDIPTQPSLPMISPTVGSSDIGNGERHTHSMPEVLRPSAILFQALKEKTKGRATGNIALQKLRNVEIRVIREHTKLEALKTKYESQPEVMTQKPSPLSVSTKAFNKARIDLTGAIKLAATEVGLDAVNSSTLSDRNISRMVNNWIKSLAQEQVLTRAR